MTDYLWIAVGGAIGAMGRHGLTVWIGSYSFPWATLTVNMLGALLIGIVVFGWERYGGTHTTDLLLRVGLCGGFTIFSSFSLDTWHLMEQGYWLTAIIYATASVAVCIAVLWLVRTALIG